MSMLKYPCLLLATLAGTGAASADAGLYDAPVPPNSAYVRMIDGSKSAEPAVSVDGIEVKVSPSGLSPYVVVPAGDRNVRFSGSSADVPLKANSFSTVVFGGPKPKTFTDEALKNPARAGLYFYNLSRDTVSLTATIKGKSAPVFENVAAGEAKFREVNAFAVELAVAKNGAVVKRLPAPVALKRQNGMSVVYFGADAGAGPVIAEANAVQR